MKTRSLSEFYAKKQLFTQLITAFFFLMSWQANSQYITENLTPTSVIKEGVALAQTSDGRIFIAERAGIVKVYQNNIVSTVTALTTTTNAEQGLLGLTIHPDFATNGYMYVFYTIVDGTIIRHRIERLKIDNTNQVVSRQEILLLEPINGGFHNGGDLKFFNGYLYITVGDSQQNANSQNFDTYKGKILRVTEDGLPAPGNPFYGSGTPQKQSIWVYGFRNPWRLVANPVANKLFVLDVGTSWEEIDEISNPTIRNYAWGHPQGGDGIQTETNIFTNPIFNYATGSIGNAITNGVFYNPTISRYPNLQNKFIFKDYVRKEIRYFDPTAQNQVPNPASTVFFEAPHQYAMGMMLGNDGYIYYCSYNNNGALIKLNYIETAIPTIVNQPLSQTIMATNPVNFTVSASGVGLTYQWQFNNVDILNATASNYAIPSVTNANAGDYKVIITNTAGSVSSNSAKLIVTPFTNAPTVQIKFPLATLKWNANDIIGFEATANDVEDGVLPTSAFEWDIDLYHEDNIGSGHSHPGGSPTGVRSGTFTASNQGEKTPNVWYRFTVTVTDSNGLKGTNYVDIYPNLVDVTVTSSPSFINLELNQKTVMAPTTRKVVANADLQTLNAPTPQYVGVLKYDFDRWSQGGMANQTFQAPASGAITYTAFYTETILPNAPYQGIVSQIPGIIEAENYDIGSSAYFDSNGGGDTVFRAGDGVGTENCNEGGYNIAYVVNNEWLKYTSNIKYTGLYDIKFRVSTPYNAKTLRLEVDGVNATGSISIPNSAGFQAWQTVTVSNIVLTKGIHVVRLFFETGDINVNKIEFVFTGTNLAPVADYEVDAQSGCIGKTVIFTSFSIGNIDDYSWNFGSDAQPSTAIGAGPHSVIYSTIGTKAVSLTATNTVGSNTKNTSFIVNNCTLGLESATQISNNLNIYPNPSSGIYHLSKKLEWTVYNLQGAKIKNGSGDLINISEYSTGVYFIKIKENNTAVRIIKQ